MKMQIKEMEARSARNKQTQIFMETPYRNNQLMKQVLNSCHPATKLLVAVNITAPDESITTKTITEWKKTDFDFHKKPAVFALLKEI
jgi:16S rRNA (cytidine1402-2'-O)-methyltransferase